MCNPPDFQTEEIPIPITVVNRAFSDDTGLKH